ncbi:hypothetical protein OsI_37678 [Oryza sativa Indica Group]|uniref:Uncharacterized protein n=1 Tax=Oryza sativa subsp. indica TaxID=39946 RepID=B8BNG1_ORYSI|nr:hypothetical protein OsI_37678 [Oryza sativa Indica Group]
MEWMNEMDEVDDDTRREEKRERYKSYQTRPGCYSKQSRIRRGGWRPPFIVAKDGGRKGSGQGNAGRCPADSAEPCRILSKFFTSLCRSARLGRRSDDAGSSPAPSRGSSRMDTDEHGAAGSGWGHATPPARQLLSESDINLRTERERNTFNELRLKEFEHTHVFEQDLLRDTGMDVEFTEVFQAIGWENFWHINEEEKKAEPLTPEQKSAEYFLKALINGELEILGGEQLKWNEPTKPTSAEEMDFLVKKYEEEQALWNSPETPIPPPPTPKKKNKKLWRKKVSSSESSTPGPDDDKSH